MHGHNCNIDYEFNTMAFRPPTCQTIPPPMNGIVPIMYTMPKEAFARNNSYEHNSQDTILLYIN